jgi:hypothetical protein
MEARTTNHPTKEAAMNSTPGRIHIPQPSWLWDAVISPKEAATLLDVNHDTVRHWMKTARLMGIPLNAKPNGKPRASAHHVYILAILAALHSAGLNCTPGLIRAAHASTRDGDVPRLPHLFEAIALNEQDSAGKPIAQIVVDLSQVWLELEPKLKKLMESEGK